MANTYTQIHLHLVFAVKGRQSLIHKAWKDELYMYITGIVQRNQHKMLAINGMPDHLHILIGLRPTQSIADLMQDIKGDSSRWINTKGFTKNKFEWQSGYGAFSYAKSQLVNVVRYIENQEQHHATKNFREEYMEILRRFDVEFEEKYIFE